jgi:hypothetical protein
MLDVTAACAYCEIHDCSANILNSKYTTIHTITFKLLLFILYCFDVSRRLIFKVIGINITLLMSALKLIKT